MRRSLIFGMAALFALTLSLSAMAVNEVTHPIKWVQLPDLQNGLDLQSQYDVTDNEPDVIKADDWICLDGLPVTDIHWWGSYLNDEAFTPDGFFINIYTNDDNVLIGDASDDLPGNAVWTYQLSFGVANETFFGVDSVGETVYEYWFDFTDTPFSWFNQEQGKKYWISIVADTSDIGSTPVWGWHTGLEPAGIGGLTNAVTGKVALADPWAVGNPDEWAHIDYNMSFILTTIPEPGTMALIGSGLLALLGLRRRRSK